MPTDPESPTPGDDLDSIVSFGELKRIRPGRRHLLTYSKPPVPPNRMTAEEIDAWAAQIVDGMAAAIGRP